LSLGRRPGGRPFQATPLPNDPKPHIYRLVADAKGRTYLDDDLLATTALQAKHQELKSADPGLGVVVKADNNIEYHSMINVLDLLRQLDIAKARLPSEAVYERRCAFATRLHRPHPGGSVFPRDKLICVDNKNFRRHAANYQRPTSDPSGRAGSLAGASDHSQSMA